MPWTPFLFVPGAPELVLSQAEGGRSLLLTEKQPFAGGWVDASGQAWLPGAPCPEL